MIGMEKSHDWTSMSVHRDTYHQVKSLKRGGESFNDLLERLVEERDRG